MFCLIGVLDQNAGQPTRGDHAKRAAAVQNQGLPRAGLKQGMGRLGGGRPQSQRQRRCRRKFTERGFV